jgi:ATP-dependent DNA ligase
MQRKMQARLASLPRTQASFIEPMECLSVSKLPEAATWIWEIKLDGYRALAVKSSTRLTLFSRNRKSLNRQFPYIVEALADLPEGTVVDGELVAIDDSGRPDFNLLQNFRAEAARIHYYVFDLLRWKERDLTRLALIERRALLKGLLVVQDKRIRIADYVEATPNDLLSAVREQRLEGIVGKQKDSHYQPGSSSPENRREAGGERRQNPVTAKRKHKDAAALIGDRLLTLREAERCFG